MSGTRIFLLIAAVLFIPYGIFCFFVPGSLAEGAGVAATSGTGSTEIRAMYGGLQTAIGALALAGFLRGRFARSALLAIGFVCTGLFTARILGLAFDGGFSAYTGGALVLEALLVTVSFGLLKGMSDEPAAAG